MDSHKAKILFVHQDGVVSGSAISLRNLLSALDRERFNPRVLLAREGPARQLYESLKIPVDVVPINGFWHAPSPAWFEPAYHRNFKALLPNKRLNAYLRRVQPDLVHINDKTMLGAGLTASRIGLPVVWHLRSAYAGGRSHLQTALSKFIIRRSAKQLIAISEDEVEGFEKHKNIHVIHNSISLEDADKAISRREGIRAELGLSEDEIAVGMVGLLNQRKGAWDFIEAAGLVVKENPALKCRFIIIAPVPGREPLNWGWRGRLGLIDKTHPEDRVWQLARVAGIADRLILTGHRADILPLLAALDVVSVCYRLWAMGRPAFEAMAVGSPVIVNEGHSGRSGIVHDGETGLIVPRANPGLLANAIMKLASDPILRRNLGKTGYQHARAHFDSKRNAESVQKIYEEVLKPKITINAESITVMQRGNHQKLLN